MCRQDAVPVSMEEQKPPDPKVGPDQSPDLGLPSLMGSPFADV